MHTHDNSSKMLHPNKLSKTLQWHSHGPLLPLEFDAMLSKALVFETRVADVSVVVT